MCTGACRSKPNLDLNGTPNIVFTKFIHSRAPFGKNPSVVHVKMYHIAVADLNFEPRDDVRATSDKLFIGNSLTVNT